jgi:signal transduction histidine kinase
LSNYRFSSRPFITRLILGAVCLNLLVLAFAAYTLRQSYENFERRAVVTTQNLAQVLAQDLAATFSRIDLAVVAVEEEMEQRLALGRELDAGSVNAYIARQVSRQPGLGALRVTDAQGRIVFGTGVDDAPQFSLAQRQYFERLRRAPSKDLLVSKPQIGQMSGKWSIVLARRIDLADGTFGGIAYAVVFLENFQKAFAALNLGPHGAVSLRDLELGTVVRHPEPKAVGTAIGSRSFSKEWPEKLKENPLFGSYFAVGLDERNRALSYRRVAGFPFYIIVGEYPADYLAEWYEELARTTLLALLFALTTGVFAWIIRRAWKRREDDARRLLELSELREADRERLTLDLHDGCIQSIYAIGLNMERARRLTREDPAKAGEVIAEATANLNLVIQDLRAFIAGEPLVPRSEAEFLAEMQRIVPQGGEAGPKFSMEIDRQAVQKLSADESSHVLRIAREAVSNIVRHADATAARVYLGKHDSVVRLEVSDDGTGLAANGTSAGGLGLHHISARARKLGGQARFDSSPEGGTKITVEFSKSN